MDKDLDLQDTQPILSDVEPANGGSLGEDYDEARWQPLSFTIENAQAPILIWAQIGDGAFSWQVVYDGEGFAPLWAQTSFVAIDGATYRFSLLPLGGWWASPTVRVGEFREIQ